MKCLGFVFARGGSKGVCGKNIRPLCGKPLIAYAIEAAKQSRYIEDVHISTDDDEIAEVAQRYGATIPFLRPAELATDNSAELLSWRHAINTMSQQMDLDLDNDILVSSPCTSPFKKSEDIDKCIENLIDTGADLGLVVTEARCNPAYNVVRQADDGYYKLAIETSKPVIRRQEAPAYFDMTGVCFAAKMRYVLETEGVFRGNLSAVVIPAERAIDIDTELDFQFAEFLGQHVFGLDHDS